MAWDLNMVSIAKKYQGARPEKGPTQWPDLVLESPRPKLTLSCSSCSGAFEVALPLEGQHSLPPSLRRCMPCLLEQARQIKAQRIKT